MKICIAHGDGIGPEIMSAVLKILQHVAPDLQYESIEIGEKAYKNGISNGIPAEAWEKIQQNKILLKAPLTTPLGEGYKSVNVTLRKKLGLFSNVRPVKSYAPFVKCNAKNMDVVIVRENEEDLYCGIEYQMTDNSFLALKFITKEGSRKIIKYAFDYAVANGRKKVTCITKNNIMKISDGGFARVFDEVTKDYPTVIANHMIVDIGSAKIASKPAEFDVVVTLNLYGDIISDIAAEAAGAVGIAGSANIGQNFAMFEAVHGSAPDIAGQGKANPSGLLNAAIMMLRHIGMQKKAETIENAWLATIEQGIHTADLFDKDNSKKLASTNEFADAIIGNIGKKPNILKAVEGSQKESQKIDNFKRTISERKVIGCDIYIQNNNFKKLSEVKKKIDEIMKKIPGVQLSFIGSKGLVLSDDYDISEMDILQLRFFSEKNYNVFLDLQHELSEHGIEIVMTNTLCEYDNKIGFSKGQGE